MTTRVVHVNDHVPGAVYIGRSMPGRKGSFFHNPYKIGRDGTRSQVLRLYRDRLLTRLALQPEHIHAQLAPLAGKPLACWCRRDGEERTEANACHGDVLVALIHELGLEAQP